MRAGSGRLWHALHRFVVRVVVRQCGRLDRSLACLALNAGGTRAREVLQAATTGVHPYLRDSVVVPLAGMHAAKYTISEGSTGRVLPGADGGIITK